MRDTGAPYNLPFPEAGDPANGPAQFEALAEAVAEALQAQTAALSAALPTGTILTTARAAAPAGFLMCDGASVSRTDYADLFAAIGTAYGAGDGATTFKLPDLRGRVPVGADGAANRLTANDALGQSGGEEKHALHEDELAHHQHGITALWSGVQGGSTFNAIRQGGSDAVFTDFDGSNAPHNNMQPYQVVNYMIKA